MREGCDTLRDEQKNTVCVRMIVIVFLAIDGNDATIIP